MTPEQYERWKDFAYRMAHTCMADNKDPTYDDIVYCLDQFFSCLCTENEVPYIQNWDHSDGKAIPVCDTVSYWAEQWVPGYWSLEGEEYEEVREKYVGPVSCCLRAGLDVACSPSGGVVGFTAGCLRRMYPEGVPGWVKDYFENPFDSFDDNTFVWL